MTPSTAMILAGGLGTRLQSLYADRPKALVPICGRPFLEHMIDGLVAQGIRRIHISAGYRATQLVDWAAQREQRDVTLTVSIEPEPLGTGGGVRFAAADLPREPLIILNGDSLLPHFQLQTMATAAQNLPDIHGFLAVVEMTERGQYGTVDFTPSGVITAFREKADRNQGWVNGGIYLFTPDLIDAIPREGKCSLEADIFPRFANLGKLHAVTSPPPLLDMGTPAGIEAMEAWVNAEDS